MNDLLVTMNKQAFQEMLRSEIAEALQKNTPPEPDRGENKELMTETELCNKLNVSKPTLWKWRRDKRIPYKKLGRNIRYNWDDVVKSLKDFEQNEGEV